MFPVIHFQLPTLLLHNYLLTSDAENLYSYAHSHMMNIYAKLHSNMSTKCRDIAHAE